MIAFKNGRLHEKQSPLGRNAPGKGKLLFLSSLIQVISYIFAGSNSTTDSFGPSFSIVVNSKKEKTCAYILFFKRWSFFFFLKKKGLLHPVKQVGGQTGIAECLRW